MIASSVHCGTVEMCLEKARIKSNSRQSNGRSWSAEQPDIRCHILRCSAPRWFSMRPKVGLMTKSPAAWTPAGRSSANGASAFSNSDWPGWKNAPDRVAPGLFPPELIVQVKALACELPATHQVPLSRWSLDELTQHVCQSGLVAQLSSSTLWRWLPPRCDSSLAAPLLDFSTRSEFRSQSGSNPRFISTSVAGTAVARR